MVSQKATELHLKSEYNFDNTKKYYPRKYTTCQEKKKAFINMKTFN